MNTIKKIEKKNSIALVKKEIRYSIKMLNVKSNYNSNLEQML